MSDFVAMGEVVKAIGLKGEVKLFPLLDYHAPVLDSGHVVWRDGRAAQVQRHRPAGSCVAVKLAGVDDRDAAEVLVGAELGFLRGSYLVADFPRPAGGLPFRYLGRDVITGAGERVGEVTEVRLGGGQLVLVVPSPTGEILIPAVAPILRPSDGLDGDLLIDPPEGLLDVHTG